MIYPNIPSYVVSGFSPPPKGTGQSGYGFAIGLLGKFAKVAAKVELTEEQYDKFHTVGSIIMNRDRNHTLFPPYGFTEIDGKMTMLLKYCRVDGSACDIGHTNHDLKNLPDTRLLEYQPHNVDNMWQAYTLLSLWIKWWEIVHAFITDDSGKYII